jgi:WD40 repeat protein
VSLLVSCTEEGSELSSLVAMGNMWRRPRDVLLRGKQGDNTARVWEVSSGREVGHMTHDGQVHAVAFRPQSTHLATAGEDGTARIWDITSGRKSSR